MGTINQMIMDAIESSLEMHHKLIDVHPRGVLWRGLPGKGELSREQLRELKSAGVEEILVNVNSADARGKWKWEGGRSKILARAELFKEEGFSVGWMPWVWCNPTFMAKCGDEIRKLDEDFGGARLCQMDWEGSAEKPTYVRAKKAGQSLTDYVGDSLTVLCERLPPEIRLGMTTLYFRRKAGNAALKWEAQVNGRHWSVSEWIGQFYSPWLTSPPHSERKAKSTHAKNFQPPILQRRGNAFYSPLYEYMEDRGAGFNAYGLKRPAMTAKEAMNAAIEEIALQGHDTVAAWAGHLIMKKPARFELTLEAFERLTKGGRRILDVPAPTSSTYPEVTNAIIRWEDTWFDPSVAGGGRPDGYVSIRKKGLRSGHVGPLAKAVRGYMLSNGLPRGTCIPCSHKTKPLVCVLQKHTATYRGGKLVTGLDLDGLTVFAQR